MGTRVHQPPPMPARALTLDQAYERAYRRLRAYCLDVMREDGAHSGGAAFILNSTAFELTKDLIDCGVGGTLAFQLARPPGAE